MKSVRNVGLFGLVLTVLLLIPSSVIPLLEAKEVPDFASWEIQRRGNFVEVVGGGIQDCGTRNFADAMKPPADDSHKFFVSVITTRGCPNCDRLKHDFARSPHLRAFVNVSDHSQSWAHYNVFSANDRSQQWRWKDIRITGYPTLIVQPPRNQRFGSADTVVWQKTGYDGNAEQLATDLRNAIHRYVAEVRPYGTSGLPSGGHRQAPADPKAEKSIGQTPSRYAPSFPTPEPMPLLPPEYPLPQPTFPTPRFSFFSLLFRDAGSALGSNSLQNLLLLVLTVIGGVHAFRKATGQKLFLDDATLTRLAELAKSRSAKS